MGEPTFADMFRVRDTRPVRQDDENECEAATWWTWQMHEIASQLRAVESATRDAYEAAEQAIVESLLSVERDESDTNVVRFIFCTGGPHYEITARLDTHDGYVDVTLLSLPWFGRIEMVLGPDDEAMARRWLEVVYPSEVALAE